MYSLSHLCVSVWVVAGVSVWMIVPPRGTSLHHWLALVSATPHTTNASSSMARTLLSAMRLMWVCELCKPERQKYSVVLFSFYCNFLAEHLPDSLVFSERHLSLQTGLAYRWHSLWTREGGWWLLLCLVLVLFCHTVGYITPLICAWSLALLRFGEVWKQK